jgi:hypothetical protein
MNKLIVLKQNSLKQKIVTLRIKNPAITGIHQQKKNLSSIISYLHHVLYPPALQLSAPTFGTSSNPLANLYST